ncbi:alpha/beta fold hydrolase [Nigerium massiliense]|uniref:alpha/beta fold hydrolase n=1 Tax=Nigerium massiliense TaxID=1522317 RepID=UPI00058B986E|nr:alpha/beta hydrolase [Nigerium massiliense]
MSDTSSITLESGTALLSTGVRMHYFHAGEGTNTLVLLHGWPETAWQWRHVIPMFAEAGYRVIAPDYRGAGNTSRPRQDYGLTSDPRVSELPRGGYDKRSMAEDIHCLLFDHLGLTEPAFVMGHDLGGQLATAYALRYRDDTRAMGYGEAPLPGTTIHEKMKNDPTLFHFSFHRIFDLPEALTAGRERWYLQHFYDKLGFKPTAVDTEYFARQFNEPGAMRAGFDLYRAFDQDALDTQAAIEEGGKLTVPTLGLCGEMSLFSEVTEAMGLEVAENVHFEAVPASGHWIAEENPDALVEIVTRFDKSTRV